RAARSRRCGGRRSRCPLGPHPVRPRGRRLRTRGDRRPCRRAGPSRRRPDRQLRAGAGGSEGARAGGSRSPRGRSACRVRLSRPGVRGSRGGDAMTFTLQVVAVVAFAYFACLNATSIVSTGIAWRGIGRPLRAETYSSVEDAFASPLTPPISILLPAYDEEAGIVESVR